MNKQKKLQVLIAEDDELMRIGLELIIQAEEDMSVIGSAANGLEAIELIKRSKPDIVLLDVQMPVMNGIDCIREIRTMHPDLRIIILTTFNEEEYIFQGLAYGANGYLLKGTDFAALIQTIRDAMNDRFLLPAEVAASVARYVVNNDTYMQKKSMDRFLNEEQLFTKKEQEITRLLLGRLSNQEIADRTFVTAGTIKNHLTAIYDKLQVQSRQQAIRRLQELADRSTEHE